MGTSPRTTLVLGVAWAAMRCDDSPRAALFALVSGVDHVRRHYASVDTTLPTMIVLNCLREFDVLFRHAFRASVRNNGRSTKGRCEPVQVRPVRCAAALKALKHRRNGMERAAVVASHPVRPVEVRVDSALLLREATNTYALAAQWLRENYGADGLPHHEPQWPDPADDRSAEPFAFPFDTPGGTKLMSDSDHYRARAEREAANATAATLENVRARSARAAKAWNAMADKAERVNAAREERTQREAQSLAANDSR